MHATTINRVLLATAVVCAGVRVYAAVDPGKKCSASKVKATAKALLCQVKEQNKLLLGKPADLTKCGTTLARDFEKAESKAGGACPTTGDAPNVDAMVTSVEAQLLTDLMAAPTSSKPEKACAVAKSILAAKYALCTATALAKRVLGGTSDFLKCETSLTSRIASTESTGQCLTQGDAAALARDVAPAEAYLNHADLSDASLIEADLNGADLSDANLSGVYAILLRGCPARLPAQWLCTNDNLVGPSAYLDVADLNGVDLSNVDLSGVHAAHLRGCPVRLPAKWTCTNNTLVGPSADLSHTDQRGVDLMNSDLSGAVLRLANLSNADLSGADLSNANLSGANLSGANLSGVNLSGANLSLANLSAANLGDVIWAGTECVDLTTSDSNGSNPESCCAHLLKSMAMACSP